MGLNSYQYDNIIREYNERLLSSKRLLEERTKEVYSKIPMTKEISDKIASLSVSYGKKLLLDSNSNSSLLEDLKHDIKELINKRKELLSNYNYPANYLEPTYTCLDCKDTGFISHKRCHCLNKRIIEALYDMSNINEVLLKENFDNFNYDYYSDEFVDPITNTNANENIKKVVNTCKEFIHDFDKDFTNLFIFGATGVGKTFLTNCIAKELIETTHSVIYISAIKLFEVFSKSTFGYKDVEANDMSDYLLSCDLLIIDDLGTELSNSFTNSALFNCINEREIAHLSTIISTNLNIAELKNNYSERLFSRITSNYKLLKVFGQDLRIKSKLT